MNKLNEAVLDRIEDSFTLFKNNFLKLFLPILLLRFFASFLAFWFFFNYSLNYMRVKMLNINPEDFSNIFALLYYDFSFILIIWSILLIFNLTLSIPFYLWVIKSIKDAFDWRIISIKDNLIYWFYNILNSFRIYYYIFIYVYLLPALIIIIWWIITTIWVFLHNSWVSYTWLFIEFIWGIIFLFFYIYRWIKSKFAIFSAIDKNSYEKDSFITSIGVTKNNWWRILWNLFLIWIIIYLLNWFISNLVWAFSYWSLWYDFSSFNYNNLSKDDIKAILDLMLEESNSSNILGYVLSFILLIVEIAFYIFKIIFTYIFFKRLEFENTKKDEIKKEENEL